jgi:zinc/manganese transport system substrate-binding protein
MRRCQLSVLLLAATLLSATAQMKVVGLHPLLADLARKVGGEHVEVISLMRPNDDPHHFNPTAAALQQTRDAALYLASGMALETYLDKLRNTLGDSAMVLEVGNTLPARETHELCNHPEHHHGGQAGHGHKTFKDPHWWHRVSNMQRAADIVAKAFSSLDPAHATSYQANARSYRAELASLDSWIRRQLIRIPKEDRKLVTAHNSFGYFCETYGFQPISIQGINKGSQPSAASLAEIVASIRQQGIKAVFPEQRANPRSLQSLARETGIRVGGTLIADGSDSYLGMMRHNVRAIVDALAPAKISARH